MRSPSAPARALNRVAGSANATNERPTANVFAPRWVMYSGQMVSKDPIMYDVPAPSTSIGASFLAIRSAPTGTASIGSARTFGSKASAAIATAQTHAESATAILRRDHLREQAVGSGPVSPGRCAVQESDGDQGRQRKRQQVGQEQHRIRPHGDEEDRARAPSVGGPARRIANRGVGQQACRENRTDERGGSAAAADEDRQERQEEPEPDRGQQVPGIQRPEGSSIGHLLV